MRSLWKPLINYLPSNLLDSGRQLFRKSIVEPNLPTSINQIYKAYIDLYHYTHWMGSTVHGLHTFLPPNYQLIMPFAQACFGATTRVTYRVWSRS